MKSEIDALIVIYEIELSVQLDKTSELAVAINSFISDLKALRDKCDNNKSGNGVYC